MADEKAAGYRSREIPRGEWLSFLDSFSRQHEGWLAAVEVKNRGGGRLIAVENRELVEITPESSEGHDRVSIALGVTADDHVTHFVSDPKRIRFLQTDAGEHAGLEIEAADGSATLVHFSSPMKPEMLDNVAA